MRGWRYLFMFICAFIMVGVAPAANDLAARLAAGGAAATANFTVTGNASGSPSNLTLKATLQVAPEDVGKPGEVYAIATLPGMAFFKDPKGAWSLWTGGGFPAYFKGALGTHAVDIVAGMDTSKLQGLAFYLGYGLDQNDMLAKGKYSQVPAKLPSPPVALEGVWEVVSGTGIFQGTGSYVAIDSDGMLVSFDNNGCMSMASYVISGSSITMTVLFNQRNASCGAEVPVGTVVQANFTFDQDKLSVVASDGSTAVLRKFTVPYYTATGSYSRTSGSIVWATSDFPCDGPMVGETASVPVTAITETTMTWFYKDGSDVWFRDAGVAGDIVGTWHLIGTVSGNLYQVTVDSDGTVVLNGFVSSCDGGQIESEEYSVWTGMSRRMTPDGETAGMVLHMHGWAPQGTVSKIALRGPGLDQVFFSHGLMDRNGVTVDDFVAEREITVPPKPGDVYTFTVTRADGTTFTRSQTLTTVLLDAPRITSPGGYALADANVGQPLNLSWTLPTGVTTNDVNIYGQVCGKSGCMMTQGTMSSATTGVITLPVVDGATHASITVSTHHAGEVFMSCRYEFR